VPVLNGGLAIRIFATGRPVAAAFELGDDSGPMNTVFSAARVFTGESDAGSVIDAGAVEVDGDGFIRAVGPAKALVRKGVDHVDLGPLTLLPGLLDLHTHLCLSASLDPFADALADHPARMTLRAVDGLRRHLDAGVTTIRDVGGLHGIDLEMQRAVDDGFVSGPQVFASGKVISMTGGHACMMAYEVDSPAEARRAARQNLKDGARVIKLIATGGVLTEGVAPGAQQLTEAEMAAAVVEAHKAGCTVAAHAQGEAGIEAALAAGVDTIEHGFWLSEAALKTMASSGQAMVPTFAALRGMRRLGEQMPRYILDKLERVCTPHLASFHAAIASGVQICTGTDAGTPNNPHGNIADELAAFREAGMPTLDCWRSATANGAAALSLEDRGLLVAGRRADMIAVSREDFDLIPGNFRPRQVWRAGLALRSPPGL
jgi:imidazolonepropionase-like amidohydrolase